HRRHPRASVGQVAGSAQRITRRENTSSTVARYSQPSQGRTYVMLPPTGIKRRACGRRRAPAPAARRARAAPQTAPETWCGVDRANRPRQRRVRGPGAPTRAPRATGSWRRGRAAPPGKIVDSPEATNLAYAIESVSSQIPLTATFVLSD